MGGLGVACVYRAIRCGNEGRGAGTGPALRGAVRRVSLSTERLGRGSYDHSIPLPAPRSHKTKNVFPKQESWKSRRWEHRYSLRALPSPKPPANALSPRGLQTPEAQAWGGVVGELRGPAG